MSLAAQHGYLAGTDAQRANDLNAMLNDAHNAVTAIRGGYGTPVASVRRLCRRETKSVIVVASVI